MILFFDTETSGLPQDYDAPTSDTSNWPRLVQIAWLMYTDDGELTEEKSYFIYPEGFNIPDEVSRVHGITTEKAREKGKNLEKVLLQFAKRIEESDLLVAHNIEFDEKIIGAEFYRKHIQSKLFDKPKLCTMESSTDYCAIPRKYGYKWPKLSELHYKLFGEYFEEQHDAGADIQATAKSFWELKKRGIILNESIAENEPKEQALNTHDEVKEESHLSYAGFGPRFMAYLIDGFIWFIINTIIWAAFDLPLPPNGVNVAGLYIFSTPFGWLILWLYNSTMETSKLQGSIGKIMLGIKVTDAAGNKISFGKSTGRNLGKIISGLIMGIGFLMAAFTEKRQALHDQMSDSLVLMNR